MAAEPAGADASPLDDAEFAALMAPFAPFGAARRVLVGVSGGADSMALAWLLRRWGAPLACVVDHRLRPESAAEAAGTAAALEGLGIPARVRVLHGLHPGPGLAQRARAARYAALEQACREAGCVDLLVAHHAWDQAETVALRRAAGSGPSGLSGMAGVSWLGAARLLRPLLPVSPARLRATLRRAGLGWVEDPANRNLNLPRARLRAGFTEEEVASLCRDACQYAARRRADEAAIAAELAACATLYPAGYARLDAPPSARAPSAQALSALIWTLSGRPHPPPVLPVARLAAALRPATLHGVAVLRDGAGWLLAREAAAMQPPVAAAEGVQWDGRFVCGPGAWTGLSLGALGADAARLRRRPGPPMAVLRTLPALRHGGELCCVPHLAFPGNDMCLSVPVMFGPVRAVAGAGFALFTPDVRGASGVTG